MSIPWVDSLPFFLIIAFRFWWSKNSDVSKVTYNPFHICHFCYLSNFMFSNLHSLILWFENCGEPQRLHCEPSKVSIASWGQKRGRTTHVPTALIDPVIGIVWPRGPLKFWHVLDLNAFPPLVPLRWNVWGRRANCSIQGPLPPSEQRVKEHECEGMTIDI